MANSQTHHQSSLRSSNGQGTVLKDGAYIKPSFGIAASMKPCCTFSKPFSHGPDTTTEKCPASLGGPTYVTGTTPSDNFTPSNLSSALSLFGPLPPSSTTTLISPPPTYVSIYPSSPPSSPSDVTCATKQPIVQLAKPLLTPRSSETDIVYVPTVLDSIFPASSTIHALPTSVVDLDDVVPEWKGAVLENPAMGTRTLYVSGGKFEDVNLRESVCGILEKAEEELGCSGVVLCLEKNTPDLGDLLHSLMYVGGTITTGPFAPNPAFILIGLDV